MNPICAWTFKARAQEMGEAVTCPDHLRTWAFPGKGFVQLAGDFFSFPCASPAPKSLHQSLFGDVGKELHLKEKESGSCIALGSSGAKGQ